VARRSPEASEVPEARPAGQRRQATPIAVGEVVALDGGTGVHQLARVVHVVQADQMAQFVQDHPPDPLRPALPPRGLAEVVPVEQDHAGHVPQRPPR